MTTAAASDYTPGLDLGDLDFADPTPAERAARLAAAGLDADPAAGAVTFVRAPAAPPARTVAPAPVAPAPAPVASAPVASAVDPIIGAVGMIAFLRALVAWAVARADALTAAAVWWVTYQECRRLGAAMPDFLREGVRLGLISEATAAAMPAPTVAPAPIKMPVPAPAPVVEAPLVAPAAAAGVRILRHPLGLGVEAPFPGVAGFERNKCLKDAGASWRCHDSMARPAKGAPGVWAFSADVLPRIRTILTRYHGTDGGPAPQATATAVVAPAPVAAPAPAPVAPAPNPVAAALTTATTTATPVVVPAPGRRGVTAPASAAETRAARERRVRREAELAAQSALDAAITVALANPTGDYPHGCLAAWRPTGEVAWSTLCDAAVAAGVPAPAMRSVRATASDAVRTLQGNGLLVETITRGSKWTVYRPASVARVGESIGAATLVAALVEDARTPDRVRLELDGPADLCTVVRDAFDRARRDARLDSAEVSLWLSSILASWRAVPTAYGRWVAPGAPTDGWRRLADALASREISIPRRPAAIASAADVRDEITAGLRTEVANLIQGIRDQRDRAKARPAGEGEAPRDLGARAALTAVTEIGTVRAKVAMYEVITGPLTDARAALDALETELAPLAGDTSMRGAMLEMD